MKKSEMVDDAQVVISQLVVAEMEVRDALERRDQLHTAYRKKMLAIHKALMSAEDDVEK